MNWVRFDFDDEKTWPETNRKIIIRYRNGNESIKYHVLNAWGYKPTDKYIKEHGFRIHTYYDEYDYPKLYHNKSKVLWSDSFVTHWAYFDEPTDGYWIEYEHDNGNKYADHAWVKGYPKGPAGEKFYELYKSAIPANTNNLMI